MAAADTSPGVMTSPPYTEQHVADKIKEWVKELNPDVETKFYEDAVNHIESIVGRQISCLETTWVERQYVKIVLEMWLRASFEKAFADLEKSSDFNTEISELLKQLKLINSFEDIEKNSSKLPAESKLRDWCKSQYLELILGQTSLFKTTPRFAILVPSYFQHFKTSLTDKILSWCGKGLTEDQIDFISALTEFLANAINRDHTRSQDILEDNFLENEIGKESMDKLANSFKMDNEDKATDVPGDRFKSINASLSDDSWTPQLKFLIKETCESFLLPKTVVDVQKEDGKEIISIKGVVVFVSKILQEMIDLKRQNLNVKEIQIVGLLSVHVDCDLESGDWHGMNVGIVTDKLYVDKEVHWDVSGQNSNNQDSHSQPGESGGNFHVICKEMINAEKWTIISDGGDGSDGLNGVDGGTVPHRKWLKEDFMKAFPTMSTFDESSNEKAMEKVLKTLEEILPTNIRNFGQDILPGHQDHFFLQDTTKDGSNLTVAYYHKAKLGITTQRHTYILSKGSKVGQGGYGGSITIEYLRSKDPEIPLGIPLVGKDGQQPPAVRMDVYEATGSVGRTGKPAGDVGFIHSVKWKDRNNKGEGHYFGFDNEVRLEYKDHDRKPDGQDFVKLITPPNSRTKEVSYASIIPSGHRESAHVTKKSLVMVEAVKMKAIIRQNLVQHLTEIDERKQTTQSLQAMLSGLTKGTTSNRIDELIGQIDRKQAQLYRYQQRQQQEKVRQGLNVKPSAFDKDSFERSKRKTDGRRPVDTQLPNSPDVVCLDLLPTANGVDSALHSILGSMNSVGVYVCEDRKRFRERLADFLRKFENVNNNTLDVKEFVLRLVNGENFPVGSAVKKEYMEYRQQNGDESQFNWPEPSKELLDEYVQFIESPFNDLAVPEVELLAKVFDITIHVYEDHSNWSSFKHKATINPGQPLEKQQFILHKSCGEWQRLEANQNLQQFCKELKGDLFQPNIQQTSYFSSLMNLLIQRDHKDLIASIKMLNPEDGVTPDKLSQLLMEKHFNILPTAEGEHNDAAIQKQLDELEPDIRLLTERVLEYNRRNWSAIFYLHVVSKCTEPHEWKYEFLLLEMEGKLTQLPANRTVWKKEILTSLKSFETKTVALLRELLIVAATGDESDGHNLSTIEPKEISRILKMLAAETDSSKIISEHFHEIPTNDWLYQLRSKIWQRKVNELTTEGLSPEEMERLKKEAVYLLLELEYKKGADSCDYNIDGIKSLLDVVCKLKKTLYPGIGSTQPIEEVTCRKIFVEVKKEDRVITKKEKFDLAQLQKLVNSLEILKLEHPNDNEKALEKLVKELDQRSMAQGRLNRVFQLLGRASTQNHDHQLSNEDALKQFLCVYDNVIRLKMGFQLRDTQRLTIMILLNELLNSTNILAQVSTGEGKSLIVAGVAIFCALSGLKVDVVTSNDVLALRDSTLSVADGGLRDLYEYFKVGVANNCSQSQDVRAKAYNSDVVYGELANFQRDYLLHTFYGLNVRGDRKFNFVIVDEVDCMLLDRGSNTLYLSHDIPGMEMLESFYVFIWERITRSVQLDVIKSQVLYDLYGAISKNDLEKIHAPLKDKPTEQNELWHYLIQAKIIDPYGRLLLEKLETNKIDYKENSALNPKLIFFFRKVIGRERHIRIPEHLLPFVDRHLDTWLANALRALELKRDEDYVIDQDRTDTSPDLNPQVIIIDPDTGTDQTTSQWDGALHQFLQLKEGCKLTPQSLKAVFISNEEYIKLYRKLTGVSGTLGSQTEKDYIVKTYNGCNYFTVPTALPKRFIYKMTEVLKTTESWLSSIIKEVRETVLPANTDEARSIVIFCRTIKDVNIVHNSLKINLPKLIADNKVHRYTRDYEQFAFEAKQLEIGHVIIATNLAGRGTDIKISKELDNNGGLHICLTYLPQNERITEQAMGRSGRKGAPGSGILILCQESAVTGQNDEECWSVGKYFSMKHERHQQELQRIARLQEDFKKNQNESEYLKSLTTHCTDLKHRMKEKRKWDDVEIKVFCDNALDQWALWLDEIDHNSLKSFGFDQTEYLESSLIDKLQLPESPSDVSWILPARSVVLATHLAQKTLGNKFISTVLDQINNRKTRKEEARKISASLLEKLAESNDAFFYPVAPYYLAFLIIKEKKGENEQTRIITKMLRSSETILNEHIRMQMSFYRKINQNFSQRHSFCAIHSYKQQKVNIANLLGHYIDSIRTLLGSHYCSASDLEKAGIDGQKVDKLFEQLKIDCIVQQPKFNDDETIPNLKAAIQHVAIIHNVDKPTSLKKNLTSAFKTVNPLMNENEIEKKIKKEIDISFTRKSFWINMVKKKVLKDAIDFVIMDESECDIEPKLDRKEKLTIDLASKDDVFFSPMPYTAEEMKRKIVFREKYVKDIVKGNNHQEYHRRKKTFELNKMGCLNLIELKKVNETKEYEAQLDEDDLRGIHIDPDERKNILAQLQNQKIIDDQGYLAPEYEGQEFCYSQCPAYEDAVMRLLGRKFAIEIVIRQWLKSEEDPELLKAIELLPLNPHRNLLADLMASHVIAGARVKDDIDLKQAIENISDDKEERECLLNYLRSRQALYGPTKSPDDFTLDFIEREIRTKKGMDNVSTELYIFGLAGFDNHIIYENKLSFKAKSQASISILGGLGLMVGGCLLDIELGGVPSLFGVNFLVTGGTASFFNGIETFLLRNKSTWADYGRQSLMNLVGNPAPFEKMSTIWKLFKSRKSIHQTPSHPSNFTVQEQNLTENQLVKVVATACKILHDPNRLFVSHLVEKINKIVDISMAKMKETFCKVWQSHNHEDIKRLVKEKMEKLKIDWFEKGETWVFEVKEASRDPTLKLDEQMAIIIKHLEHFAFKIRMVHVTVEYLKRFLSDLEEDFSMLQPSTLTSDHFDVEMGERFYKKVVENMKSELARKAEQIMELFPIGFESSITKQKDAEQK